MKTFKIITSCLLVAATLALAGCGNTEVKEADKVEEQKTEATINHSAYSWDREFFDETPADVLSQLSDYKLTRIYQGLYPADLREPAETEKVVKALAAEGVEVVYLIISAFF